jgi:hypothetical protein
MTDLFLIAHRVRGEPAFDVAIKMTCPECGGYPYGGYPEDLDGPGCHECDSLGFWWIIPTSGHRAYPWWSHELADLCDDVGDSALLAVPAMPPNHPDHYHLTQPRPATKLIDRLNLRPTQPPIVRRI